MAFATATPPPRSPPRARACRARQHTPRAAAGGDGIRAAIAAAGGSRGILGLDGGLRAGVHAAVEAAEASCGAGAPAADGAAAVHGAWRLLYTTLTILGRRRVKLAISKPGRPGFVTLGEFFQVVDAGRGVSTSVVVFEMAVGGAGTFSIAAPYVAVGERRVRVEEGEARLRPERLVELLGGNVGLLTEIFDPKGFLDITYLDEDLRVGRDDKGHLFVLERCDDPQLP